MQGSTPTEWLKAPDAPGAEDALAAYLLSRARALAVIWIGNYVRGGVGPTDVAQSAAMSLLDDIREQRARPVDSRELLGLLARYVRNKSIDKIRERTADKRDVGRETVISPLVPNDDESPEQAAVANELAAKLMELVELEPDALRRLVTYLGIIEGFSAAEIIAAIERHERKAEWHVPSVRSIQVWLRAARSRIEESLRREGFLDDE